MCGIVGFLSVEGAGPLSDCLPAATHSLAHRGPDDDGHYTDSKYGLGLGQRRLSIIDLTSAGHQPMVDPDGRTVIVFNGEIYNFRLLKSELMERGHRFVSSSDTEIILKAYRQWGPNCLHRFVGMFAFALWDQRQQTLFLARDRLGIKPLYYYYNGHTFLFGSELKALMAFTTYPRIIDNESFLLYLHYQYVPAPRTIFQDTYKLDPGHYLMVNGEELTKRQWWAPPPLDTAAVAPRMVAEKDALRQLEALLTQAVSDRLISDVPLGALLSGGIDSSIVVAMMQKVSRSPVRTFSIGFDEAAFDEAPWARRVAAHLGTDHTELYLTPDHALDTIPQLPHIYDEPFADFSAIPTYLVSKLTRRRVTVALSGDGGDEQFAGYVRYWMMETLSHWIEWLPTGVRRMVKSSLRVIPTHQLSQLYRHLRHRLPQRFQVANFTDRWDTLVRQLNTADLAEWYRMTISIWSPEAVFQLTGTPMPPSRFDRMLDESAGRPAMDRLMAVDRQTYLPDAMLTKVDRASMAVGLEVRVPLLDHRLVEFSSQLPIELKYKNGKGKYLLMELLKHYLPRRLVERPKRGFSVPIAAWFRNELRELLNDYLSSDRLKAEGRLNVEMVRQTVLAHQSGQNDHHHRLWTLLMWEMWRERWL